MNVIYRGQIGSVNFVFAVGDLLEKEFEAIVSSEQTDFVLSKNSKSISGQIWKRYGKVVQDELDQATAGHVLGPGTVVETSGGDDFKRIFHAGFHDPDDWPGMEKGSTEAEYFGAIGKCIRQVLYSAKRQGLKSVAFPLLGCGLFGLDERMLMLQFIDAISRRFRATTLPSCGASLTRALRAAR